ncbi:sensor histidine kinase [Cohnella sp. WQ 127256]|uniref:cache domain-containing sensor histidine kinase n=1 Tax=Cohnella sp. WQ 127256 TaxID=2938790 RepID=UPI002117BAC2|nr:sensor histidine kinase [Cohnella sp. WQ 127256]
MFRIQLKGYREWSIKRKLLTMTGLLLLGSVFMESYLSYTQYTRDFEKQSSDKVQQIIEQVSLNIDTYLDDLYRLTLFPYRNDAVMSALEEPAPATELAQLERRRLIENFLDEIMIYPRQDILRVSIMTDQIYSSARLPTSLVPDDNVESYDWYKQALSTQEYIFVPTHLQPSNKGNVPVFSIVKQFRSISNTQNILGVIKADANYNGIVDIIGKAEMGQDGGLFILDDNHNFIYSSNDEFKATILSKSDTTSLIQKGYMMNTTAIPQVKWTIIALSSVSEMNQKAIKTRNTAFLFAIGSALFAILVLILLIRHFLKPLLSIVKLMKEVELGRLDVTFQSNRKDEIGYLGAAFNRLVGKIGEMLSQNTVLVKEVYESKLLQQEAQINTLFNQIRPHFIFNTLNLISLSMQSGKQDKAIEHINQLSSILRSMTLWDKEMPLHKEIELLHAYLGIQSSRYEGRLSYRINIDCSLNELLVPALLLQPIVENAVLHGCERKKEKTTITIISRLSPGLLEIEVHDDGLGMDHETLLKLQNKVDQLEETVNPNPSHTGIGLVNVNKRIKVKYGERYGIRIESQWQQGTTATLSLPYPRMEVDSPV